MNPASRGEPSSDQQLSRCMERLRQFETQTRYSLLQEEVCDETSVREVCATQEPSTEHTWTKTCSVPPNIKDEVLREVLLHTNTPKVNQPSSFDE